MALNYTNIVTGTIPAGGTLSQLFDLPDIDLISLMVTSAMTTGTLYANVATDPDGTFVQLQNLSNQPLALATGAGTFAISHDLAGKHLVSSRYIKFSTSTAQTNGLTIALVLKGF